MDTETSVEKGTELIVKENISQEVFTSNGIDKILDGIKKKAKAQAAELTIESAAGRKAIASVAYKVAQSKTFLDDLGKGLVTDWKKKAKAVDVERKKARDFLDALKDEIRKPLSDWEVAEKIRIDGHKARLEKMKELANPLDYNGNPWRSAVLEKRLAELESTEPLGGSWDEFADEAAKIKNTGIAGLKAAIIRQKKFEADQAELERLREEREERERKEAEAEAERVRIANEAKSKVESVGIEKTESPAVASEQRSVAAAIPLRTDHVPAPADPDKERRDDVNLAILAALTENGIPGEVAVRVIQLVNAGKVPYWSIGY